MGDKQDPIDEKNIRLIAAETMRQRVQQRALVEVIIVGMRRRQSPWSILGHQRRDG